MLPIQGSVLVVDDDTHILRMMQLIFETEGCHVITATDGIAALEMFDDEKPGLVLLDVRMPGNDGYEVCRQIRSISKVPIIMVTAKGEIEEKAHGLDSGADDYITKPFSVKELLARIKAVMRRSKSGGDEISTTSFCSDDLVVDFAQHKVTLSGEEINLTATEHKLLHYLTRHAGQVLTPDQLLEAVWGEKHIGEHHLLRVNMTRLRQKLAENSREPKFINTKVGIGYQFLAPAKGKSKQHLSVAA